MSNGFKCPFALRRAIRMNDVQISRTATAQPAPTQNVRCARFIRGQAAPATATHSRTATTPACQAVVAVEMSCPRPDCRPGRNRFRPPAPAPETLHQLRAIGTMQACLNPGVARCRGAQPSMRDLAACHKRRQRVSCGSRRLSPPLSSDRQTSEGSPHGFQATRNFRRHGNRG